MLLLNLGRSCRHFKISIYKKHMKIVVLTLLVILAAGCGASDQPASNPPVESAPVPAPDEGAAIDTLKRINEAQSGFFQRNRRYALDTDELRQSMFLSQPPSEEATGYSFRLRPSPDASQYTVLATPLAATPTSRHFFTNQTGEIRMAEGAPASVDSPIAEP